MGSPAQAANIDRLNVDPLLTITHRKVQKHVSDYLTSSSHAHKHNYMASPHPVHRHITPSLQVQKITWDNFNFKRQQAEFNLGLFTCTQELELQASMLFKKSLRLRTTLVSGVASALFCFFFAGIFFFLGVFFFFLGVFFVLGVLFLTCDGPAITSSSSSSSCLFL